MHYNYLLVFIFIVLVITLGVLLIKTFIQLKKTKKENLLLQEYIIGQEKYTRTSEAKPNPATAKELYIKKRFSGEVIMAMILHDLRSPTRFLSTISKNLLKNFKQQTVEENFDHLLRLQDSILSLHSFIESSYKWVNDSANLSLIKLDLVAIHEVLGHVKHFLKNALHAQGNDLQLTSSDIYWVTDPNILQIVVRNILDNANKFTRNGTIILNAVVADDDKLIISVQDNGSGLSKVQIKEFLNPGNDSPPIMGSKMILAMLRKLNGRLNIESSPGEGSLFIIELPVLKVKALSPSDVQLTNPSHP